MCGPRSDTNRSAPTRGEWHDLLKCFSPASPDLLARRELHRRADTKFVLSPAGAINLVHGLARDYAVVTAGEELVARYDTFYFDTPNLHLFHSHRRGRRLRHKVRIRHYPDRRLATLEVKSRRSELQSTKLIREHDFGDHTLSADDRAFIARTTGIDTAMVEQIRTHFGRIMLLGLLTSERVTIDVDLQVEAGACSRSFSGVSIVEVKQWPLRRSTPVMLALRSGGWRPGGVSKYCVGIMSTRPDVRFNNLLPGLRALERGAA